MEFEEQDENLLEDELLNENLNKDEDQVSDPVDSDPIVEPEAGEEIVLTSEEYYQQNLRLRSQILGTAVPEPAMNIGQYVSDDLGKYKQDLDIQFPEQLDDLGEFRGATQTTADKWGNGMAKFGGKTFVNVVGGLAGWLYGGVAAAATQDASKMYNNDLGTLIDHLNESMDETLPNHYTKLEREKGVWDQMGTANFWSDKVTNGFSFLAGAALTEVAATWMGGGLGAAANWMRISAQASRLFKNASLANKLGGIAKRASQFASKKALLDTAVVGRQLLTGANYESGIEARHAYNEIKSNYIDIALGDRLQIAEMEKGGPLSEEEKAAMLTTKEKQDIENRSTELSNLVYAGNFALVGSGHMIMIPSLYGVGVRNIMKRTPYLGKHFVRTAVASEAKLAKEAAKGAFRVGAEKVGKAVGSMAGKGLYEGVVEEGGQGVMQRAAADYALLSGIRKDTGMGDMWDSVAEGISGSYGTAEGQSEVVIGAMLGALGLPVSIKGTGLTGVDAYRKADTRRKVMEMLIKMQEKNPSVLNSVRTNAYFHENVSKRSDLKDSAYEGGDMALVKDLEFDDFFDYVTVKLLTGQYEDIEDQNKQILEMSPEQFRAWGQYTTENLADDQIASRQSEVVAAVRERARAIQEVTNQVDSQIRITDEEKVLGLQKPGTRGYNRLQVIHALASIKNTEEREEALTAIVAKLTGGTLSATAWSIDDTDGAQAQDRTSTIEYTDAEGNIKSVDIGAFTDENQTRGTLASILSVIKTLEAQEKTPEISEQLKNLYASRDTVAKIAALEGTDNALTSEEYEQIVAPWKAADPTGFNIHAEEVFTALADIRKLRAKRQEAGELYKKLMDPAYEMQTIQAIVDKINTLPQEATPEEAEAKKEAKEAEKKKAEQKTKRGLKTFLNRLKLARTAKIQDLKRIEEEIAALKTYLNEYLEELTAKKGDLWVMDWKKNAGTVKELKEAIENIEKEVETAEAWLADLQKDRDNVVEILTLMDEFEKSPPDTSTYSKEIYGSTKALADALGIEIDFKEVPKSSALAVKEEIKAFKEDMERHAESMGFAAEELREQLDNLLEYKDILTRTLNTHIEEARKEGIEWDPADVRWLRQELKVTDTALEKTKQAFDFVQKRSERSGSIVNNLDESYTRLWTYKFIQSMRVTEVEDEQEDDAKPKAKGVTPSVQTAEEVEKTEGKPGLRKTHIKDGMGRTVGSHESNKKLGVLNGALDTYKRLKAEIYLDEREKIELKIAESQLRWFNWMQSTPANGQYSLAAITINNIPEELDGVLTPDMFYDETDIKLVAYHNYDRRAETAKEKAAREQTDKKRKKPSYYKKKDISRNKFVILDSEAWEDGATVKTKAAVFTSAMLPYATTRKGAPRFRGMDIKKGEITQSEIEDIEQAHEIWRNNILESAKEENGKKVYLFPVTGKSNGAPVEGELEQNSKKIKGNSDFASIPLYIGTTAKGIETPIELNVGTMAVTTRAGIVWAFDSVRENAVRMTSRTLDDQEVVNVARLLHKFLDVRGKSKAKSVTDKWKEARNYEFEIDGTTITLEKAIQSIIYMGGAYKQKESKEFQLRYEKGVLIFGDKNQEIDLENFELGDDSEVYNSFITFLRTKLHNVDKGLASKATKQYSNSTKGEKNYNTYKANPESKYVEVILDESLDHLAESTVWDNYNSYLLTPRTDKRLSPLRTRQKSILPNNGATSLDAPTHKGGYWSFESNMNTASVFTKEGQKPKTASADRQQEAWTEEDEEDSRSTGEELGDLAARQGVETKTVDITDIQDEVEPTQQSSEVDARKKIKKKGTKGDPSQKMSDAAIAALQKQMGVKEVGGLGFTKKRQAPKGKGTSEHDTDAPFLESNYTLPSEEYLEEEFGEELRRIQEMMDLELGSIDPKTKKFRAEQGKRVAGLISVLGGEGYAMLSDFGKVVVSELAPGGALYHEGFHNISLHILSPRDRAILYNQVRSIEGKALPYKEIARSEQDPKYNPKSKSLSEFTDKEAEEWLAEEFRRYALSKGKYSVGKDTVTKEQKGFFESLFDTLRDVIRYILRTMRLGTDLSPNEMSVESMEAIDSLFNKIASGKFKGVQKNTLNAFTESPAMAASMILNEQSSSFEADAVSSLTAYMTRSLGKDLTLRTGETVRMDFKDFLTESLPANVQDLESAQLRVYGEAFVRMKKDLEEGIENKSIPSDVRAQMTNTLYYFWDPDASVASSRRSNLYQLHSEYLRQLGVDVEVEDARSEEEVSAAFVDSATKLETSPTNAASGIVKFLLGTIPNASETNSLGLEGVYPLASVSQNLQTELEGTMMYRDQLEKVAGLQSRFPWAKEVLQRLGKYVKDGTEDYSTIKIQVAFAMQMKKTLYNISMQTLQETGRMYDFDPGLEKNLRVIRGRWMSRARIQSRKNQHVKISRGRLVYDPKSAVKFNNKKQTLKEIQKQLTGARTEFKLDALALIGFEFDASVRERLLEKIRLNENFPGISESYKQVIDDAVAFLYQDITSERSTQMVDLFNRENAVTVTRTNRLAKIQMRLSDTPNELSRQMPDGKVGYALAANNTVSLISNIPIGHLQNTYYPSEDNLDKNPFAFSSLTLEVLRGDTEAEAENSGKIDVFIRDGLAIEGAGQVGVKTSKLRATDNLASYVETIMNGIFPVLRAADISTDFAVKFPIKNYKSMSANKNEVMQILLNYLEDEIVAANVGITENVQIKQFTDVIGAKEQGMGPLRMFQTLVKYTSNEVRTNINKFVEDPDVTRKDIEKFIDTYAEDELMPSMERVLREDMQELKDFMNEYNLINVNADNTIQLFGINREHFGKEELPEKVSPEKFDKFLEEIIVKNTIYKNELFKMFLGDPAFYSDLYKRLKGAVGVRDMFIVDPELDNWLNNEEYSRTKDKGDGKIADGTETMMVVQEPTARTEFLEQYMQELSPKVAEQWQKDIDKADATILVPLHVYKEMAIRGDVWGTDQNEVYNNMWDETNYNQSEYPFGTFPPLKFQYNGYLPDGGRKTVAAGFFKMSVAPIFPQMANIGNENFTGINRMYNFLKKNQLGGIIVPSAFKVGAPVVSDQVNLFDGPMIKSEDRLEQALLDTVGKGEVLIDYTFMGTQLEVPSKFKGRSPIATQARVQVLSDLFENGELIDESLREDIEEYNEVFDELITRGYKSLLDELNLEESSENGVTSYKVINDNYTPFIEALRGESIRREMPPQVLSSLEALQKRNDTDKPMYFDLVSNKARLEGVLWSMAAKKVIKQKFKGDMYVQMSSLGFEVAKQGTNTSDEALRLKPLPAYDLREENPQLNVYLPHYFKEFVDENVVITSRGIESNGRVISRDTSLLNLIGIRIPTDGIHSIESIKVAGFLDPRMGPTIIVPSELVTKSGSDFDIDKLVLYFPSYNIKNGKLVKESIPYSVEAWFENEKRSFKRSLATLKDMEEVMTVERLLNTTQEEREAIEKLISEMFSSKLLKKDAASNVFGEALRETGGVTLEQSERLAMYLNTDPELAIKSYRRIKKIVEDNKVFDQTFEGWLAQDDNSEETIYTVASRGALQNSIMENMNTFITHPSRRNVFLNPVQTTEWDRLADMLLDMYRNSPEDIDMSQMKDYHKQTNIPYVIRVSEAFNKAEDLVGIEALTSTHHVKAQIADLKLNLGSTLALPSDAYSENRINFAGFEAENDAGVASLARVRQKETVAAYVAFREYMADNPEADENVVIDDFIPRISDTISQGVNVSVDAVNNPIMHLLKINPDNASAWTLLTRLGVDMETIAMFMNQPIVKDYLKMSDIGRSRTAKVSDTAIYDDKIATKLKNRYATNALAPDVPTAFTASQLKEMIQDSRTGDLKNHTNMTDIEKRQQLQILTDMFRYLNIGTALSDIVNAQSFDTKAPKNRNQLKITLANYKTALSSGLFENAEKIAGMDIPNVDTTQPTTEVTENFQGYKGGFESKGKGTPQGDGKDNAMREIADSALVELASNKPSSSKTTIDQLGEIDENSNIIMLARNGKLKGKPLRDETKRRIDQAMVLQNEYGVPIEFVVGDMPGVDSQFIDYLQEIGAKFTIYHTGNTSRISIPISQSTTEVTEGVSEVFESNPELAEIGTEEQYNAYLDTIFPDSKVKDIVYHGSKNKFEKVKGEYIFATTSKPTASLYSNYDKEKIQDIKYEIDSIETILKSGVYGAPDDIVTPKDRIALLKTKKELEKTLEAFSPVKSFLLNIRNLADLESRNTFGETEKEKSENQYQKLKQLKDEGFDGAVTKDDIDAPGVGDKSTFSTYEQFEQAEEQGFFGDVYVAFENNQVHTLGSNKDIQGFKDFVDGAVSPATFMRSMTKYNYDMQNMFNDLYITDKLTKEAKVAYDRVLNQVIKVFTNPKIKGLSIDDKGKILNKFEDGFISFVVQRMASTVDGIALGASLENLMFGEQSMAMRIADIQDPDGNHPLRDNLFIQALIPVISPVRSSDKEGYTNDYLTPTNKTMTPYEMKQLYDGFLEIAATDNKLSSDIIKTAYFQAGTGSTVSSFLNLIPGEAIMITLSKPIDKFLKTSEDFVQEIPNYYKEFFQNNHYNNDIVPKHNDYSKLVYPMTYLLDKKSKEAYKIALKAGEVPPPIKKVYFWNATGTSAAEVVRGSRSLENYTGISRIPSNNAKQQGRSKGTKYTNKKRRC